ncbi:MAG: hypothetical protein LBS99_03105 [Clostridiales bacterium]|jgi:predicted transcriptional regulator|nr:hypothetical protein [Clostridiales bacterium]
MTIQQVAEILDARVLCCEDKLDTEVKTGFGADMMSDVLAYVNGQGLMLLTGLINPQVVRTSEMMDITCIVFVRGKIPEIPVIELASARGIVLLTTQHRMFGACGKLYSAGITAG